MKDQHFDTLTKRVHVARSRRGVLRGDSGVGRLAWRSATKWQPRRAFLRCGPARQVLMARSATVFANAPA